MGRGSACIPRRHARSGPVGIGGFRSSGPRQTARRPGYGTGCARTQQNGKGDKPPTLAAPCCLLKADGNWRAWMESNHRLDVRSVVSCPLNDRRVMMRVPGYPRPGGCVRPLRRSHLAAGAIMRMTGQTGAGGSATIILRRAYLAPPSALAMIGLPRCSAAWPSRGAFVAAYGRPVGVEFPALERIPRPQYLSGFGPAIPTLGWHLAPGTDRSVRRPVVDIRMFCAGYGSGSSARPGRFVKASAYKSRGAGRLTVAGADLRHEVARYVEEPFFPAVDPRRASACAFTIIKAGRA